MKFIDAERRARFGMSSDREGYIRALMQSDSSGSADEIRPDFLIRNFLPVAYKAVKPLKAELDGKLDRIGADEINAMAELELVMCIRRAADDPESVPKLGPWAKRTIYFRVRDLLFTPQRFRAE